MTNITNKSNFVAKHTAAVHISNDLTLVDRRIYNLLIKTAFPKLLDSETHSISIEELLKELGHNKDYNNYRFIKESVKKLVDSSIQFNILGKDKKKKWESAISLLSSAHFTGGVVLYSFPKELSLSFSKPNIYASLNLDYQKKLSSKFTIALWEYCTEQLDSSGSNQVKTSMISLDKLRVLLGATEATYNTYRNLNKFIIRKSIHEINTYTDLEVECNPVKHSRTITGVTFEIMRKQITPSNQLPIEQTDIVELINTTLEKQDLYSKVKDIGIDQNTVDKYLKSFPLNEVCSAFDLVQAKIQAQEKINNITGYIWTILERGIQKSISSEIAYSNLKQKLLFENESHVNQSGSITKEFLLNCREIFGDEKYRSWIAHLSYLSHNEEQVVFMVSSSFIKEWIENNYKSTLLSIWQKYHPQTRDFILQVSKKK